MVRVNKGLLILSLPLCITSASNPVVPGNLPDSDAVCNDEIKTLALVHTQCLARFNSRGIKQQSPYCP